jgi:signal recognition particle subunit SRP54
MGMRDRMRAMQDLGKGGMLDPGGRLARQKKGTGKRLSPKERAKAKRLRDKEVRRRKREARSAKG